VTSVDFQWNVLGGESADGGTRFDPGSTLEGTVILTPQTDLNCSGVKIRLEWHTEGRGDRDRKTAGEIVAFRGVLPGGQLVVLPFRFTLPSQPWSYSGFYINILWELVADVDLPLAINPKSRYPILLRPQGAYISQALNPEDRSG
jgi:hypothetical protein